MASTTTMTKKDARAIVEAIARDNAAGWLREALAAGEVFYNIEHVSRDGMSRWITLAIAVERHGRPTLDFFWPSASPQYTTDDPGEQARAVLGWSEAVEVAAKAVGFSMRRRCFVAGGCGMDMVFATVAELARAAGVEGDVANALRRTSLNRAER